MRKNIVSILAFMVALPIMAQVGSYQDYVKKQKEAYAKYKEDQEKGIAALKKEYSDFVEKRNKEYADYLEKNWKAFETFKGIKRSDAPKPIELPKYTPPAQDTSRAPIIPGIALKPIEKPVIVVDVPTIDPKIAPRIKKITEVPVTSVKRNIDFFGQRMFISVDKKLVEIPLVEPNEKGVAAFWRKVSDGDYDPMVDEMNEAARDMNLNDWGYYQLCLALGKSLYPAEDNMAMLTTWFVMNISGYETRIAYAKGDTKLYLLPAISGKVYGLPYLTIENHQYYFVNADNKQVPAVMCYENSFDKYSKPLSLELNGCLNFEEKYKDRTITFDKKLPAVKVRIPVNTVAFYNTYPQADLSVYLSASMSPSVKDSMFAYFKPLMQGKTDKESVGLLMRFIHNGFEYQTDQQQFNREKWFFPDEVFYYPACDCEDRSALLSWLVRNLVGREVVGLNYPGHVALAVDFGAEPAGDYVVSGTHKYTVCDPTYIGAPVGETMPQCRELMPKIVAVVDQASQRNLTEQLWAKVEQAGGYPGDGDCMVTLPDGKVVLAGCFDTSLKLGQGYVSRGARDCFVAAFDSKQVLQWVKAIGSEGADFMQAISLDAQNNIILTGNFAGTLSDGIYRIPAGKSVSVYAGSINPAGSMLWLKNLDLGTLNDSLYYIARFKPNGEIVEKKLIPQTDEEWTTGLFRKNDEFVAQGSVLFTPGMQAIKKSVTHFEATFDVAEELKSESDKLVSQSTESNIASLYALLNILNRFENELPGDAAQRCLDKYNPDFKNRSALVYESIGKVDFIKNAQGIITIKSRDESELNFKTLRIKNGTRLKVLAMGNGNIRLEIISGIKVGKPLMWFPLNYVMLLKRDGNLLFDYDSDHVKVTMNLKKDILDI